MNKIVSTLSTVLNAKVANARRANFQTVTGAKAAWVITLEDGRIFRVWEQGQSMKSQRPATCHLYQRQITPVGGGTPYWFGDSYDSIWVYG